MQKSHFPATMWRSRSHRSCSMKNGMGVELIEAKSGNDFKMHSAMDRIRKIEGWKFEKATVLCKGNIEAVEGVWYYPWYMVMFMKVHQPPKTMKYEIDLSALQS